MNPADANRKSRADVVYQATIEVAPAVVTAVATTIVSFLPVFFLTGRDYRLFSPLAFTKTFAIAAAMMTAVTIVPALSRLMLRSANYRKRTALIAAVAFATLISATSHFLWGSRLAEFLAVPHGIVTVMAAAFALIAGWQLMRERIRPIEEIPSSRFVRWIYAARLRYALNHKAVALSFPAILLLFGVGAYVGMPTVLQPVEKTANFFGADLNELPGYVDAKHVFTGLQSDDWIALDEGSWFYMPTLYPAASFSQAMQVLQTQDVLIGQIPEVKDVLGKIGRVESALDPAPAAMIETYVMLRPESEWREGVTARDVWDEINRVATLPGVTPASALQPIEGRVVMLQSGIKAPMAIRVYGDDLQQLADAAMAVSRQLKESAYVNGETVNPDIVLGKPYVEFTVDRDAASRYGMTASMVNQVIETALGGMNLIKTVEGRERYPVRLRYNRDLRERIDQMSRLPVVTHSGAVVPLAELATLETTWGPGAINSENARLVAHVSFMTNGAAGDLESVSAIEQQLRDAQALPPSNPNHLSLPPGYSLESVGSFRNQIEANRRLMWIIPMVMLINLLLIYVEFRSLPDLVGCVQRYPCCVRRRDGVSGLDGSGTQHRCLGRVHRIIRPRRRRRCCDGNVHPPAVAAAASDERRRHSQHRLRSGIETNSSLYDDDRYHACGVDTSSAGQRPRCRRRTRDGDSRIWRHASRAVHFVHRSHAVQRLSGIKTAFRFQRFVVAGHRTNARGGPDESCLILF